jgi:hypothetical protein
MAGENPEPDPDEVMPLPLLHPATTMAAVARAAVRACLMV